MQYKNVYKIFLLMVLVFVSASCSGRGGMSTQRAKGVLVFPLPDTARLQNVKKIAVIDFHEHKANTTEGDSNVCPVSGLHFIGGLAPEGSGTLVADQLRLTLKDSGFDVIHRKVIVEALKGVAESRIKKYSATFGAEIGRKVGADIVMMGSVMKFKERVGNDMAAEEPASVGLALAVINASDGKILWKGKFEKSQKALLTNVLDYKTFFDGGMVWQRASQLSQIGISNLLERLPIRSAH